MGKNLEPKCKQCRRVGEKLMLKGERCNSPKCAMVKRNYPPGIHGPRVGRRQKISEYGLQLAEKQKARKQYTLMEKQFRLTFERAQKRSGDTGSNLLILLETRLDNLVYRAGFASSRHQARQLVNHGHFLVNDKKVNVPSYQVKQGDVVKAKDKAKRSKHFKNIKEKLKQIETPGWLSLNMEDLEVKMLHEPTQEDLEKTNLNTQMIIEYYS